MSSRKVLLNQIIAVEKGVKQRETRGATDIYHLIQKPDLLSGISRTYRPKDDDGERLPAENKQVQVKALEKLSEAAALMTKLFDVTATKDYGNCGARADILVDGKVLLSQVPVTYLLFLEKQLSDLHALVSKITVLDPSEQWTWDPGQALYTTEGTDTTRTKKVPRNHVKAEATDKHPAQVEVYNEDIVVGYWRTVKRSGALSQSQVNTLVKRVETLQEAVKFAREKANSTEVDQIQTGGAIFGYLLNGL